MLWLKATKEVLGRGLMELLCGLVITLIAFAICGAIALGFWLLFSLVFWLFGDAWFYAFGDWMCKSGIIYLAWGMVGLMLLIVGYLVYLDIKRVKQRMEEEGEV